MSFAKEKTPIKIAFVGTSCIGKTTLLDSLRQTFTDAVFSEEAARIFFSTYKGNDRFSVTTQGQIQDLALANEQAALAKRPRVIFCDRSVLDAAVYTSARGDIQGARQLFERVIVWLPTYHRILLLDPADVPYQKDEIRQEEKSERQRFHEEFIRFFAEHKVPYEILSGTPQQRIDRIRQIVKELETE